ncbi:transposase [Microbispora sp. NBC_01189]|uniref:transposase n=1 Tax=Microbispora sp. NBC_01189 TaxID=2903583 RepID=UPI002E151AED|nr:transposase [Microbispora sp. NBC_01189]
MRLRDELGTIFSADDFADLFPGDGRPAESPGRVVLALVLQYAEGLSDRQAADAVRGRLDWKYALGLEVEDAGFDFSVFSEFRDRVIAGSAEERIWNCCWNVRGRLGCCARVVARVPTPLTSCRRSGR